MKIYRKNGGLSSGISGIVESATNITIVDNTKDFEENILSNKIIRIVRGTNDYYRSIISNMESEITFTPIKISVAASVTIGAGEGDEGQLVLTMKGELIGDIGNSYSFQIVNGEAENGEITIELVEVNNLIKVTVNKTSGGEQMTLAAGSLETLIVGSDLSDLIETSGLKAGNLPAMSNPSPFTNGEDEINPIAGDKYIIV